jgi:hypothetical protein
VIFYVCDYLNAAESLVKKFSTDRLLYFVYGTLRMYDIQLIIKIKNTTCFDSLCGHHQVITGSYMCILNCKCLFKQFKLHNFWVRTRASQAKVTPLNLYLKHNTLSRLLTNTEVTHSRRVYAHIALDSHYIFNSTLFKFTNFYLFYNLLRILMNLL